MEKFRNKLIKAYEETPIADLPASPVHALQGVSQKDEDLLIKSFNVKTIADLARLKYADWALEIIEWAQENPEELPDIYTDKLIKTYEKKKGKLLLKAPAYALQGLSKPDAERLKKAFNVKTIADLANLKYIQWAREICLEAQKPAPLANEPEKPGKGLPWFWIILILLLIILGWYIYTRRHEFMQPRDPGVHQETQLESTGNKPELKNPIIDNVEESEAEPAPIEQTTSTKNETGSVPDSENEYIVKGGDTLASISDNLLGSFEHSSRLYELNKDVIKNPNIIFPGQKLKLPAKE